jgi:zinc-ribbon domain
VEDFQFCNICGHKISASSLFCSKCGARLDEGIGFQEGFQPTSKSDSAACPICGKSDQVQRASAVVDSTTTTTTGGMISAPIIGHGPVVMGGFSGTTRSELSRRIIYFNKPMLSPKVVAKIAGSAIGFAFLALVVGIFSLVFISKINAGLSILVSPIVAIATFVIPPLRMYQNESRALIPSQKRWERNLEQIRSASYCLRDDICFDGNFYGKPEQYAIHIYETYP